MKLEGTVIFEKISTEDSIALQPIASVQGLTKVFGPDPGKALALHRSGHSKQEIHEKTGATLALNNVSFEIMRGEQPGGVNLG